ncbi:flagellar motor protein MotB [Pseudogracilibacillus sp. SO30301A]|uniref:flagellar motor protein MotB n=1 Tax=Pseudogracilibacillus sp. SO30301A TaxID=3098291 RepID=UPI00300DCFDA
MVTLVLVFFILLFSISQIDVGKFQNITEPFKVELFWIFYLRLFLLKTNPGETGLTWVSILKKIKGWGWRRRCCYRLSCMNRNG